MTAAVYIVSSNDNVDNFASTARKVEYQGGKVLVGAVEGNVCTVILAEGSPEELKNALRTGSAVKSYLDALKSHVEYVLKETMGGMGYDELRVFVHFGGMGEDENVRFNEVLKKFNTGEMDRFGCYAVSFGNRYPSQLFQDFVFSPPHGDLLAAMCEGMQNGKIDDFEHLRALRLFLPRFERNDEGRFAIDDLDDILRNVFGGNRLGHVLTDDERTLLSQDVKIMKIFNMDDKDDWARVPDELLREDYEYLMSNLLSKGDST